MSDEHAKHDAGHGQEEDHGGHAMTAEFSFDGAQIPVAAPGQSIAGALHCAEEYIISRSFKYHRPRGLLCVSGRCPNCLCTVDGTPNVRVCTTAAKPGMVVESQNVWPSRKFDVLSIFDKLHSLMPVGFYYKMMYKPRWMWPVWEKFIRGIAGLGKIDRKHGADATYDKLNLFTDVAVVGGGWAGLHAALAAADAGSSVTLIDEQPALGGHFRHDPDLVPRDFAEVLEKVLRHPSIKVISSAVVFGAYEENYLGIQQGNRMLRLRAKQVVIAAGGWERPLVFENNDLPGILLASGVQRLLHLDRARFPGTAVVVTDSAQGYRVARQLLAAGTQVEAIVDLRQKPRESTVTSHMYPGYTIRAAFGTGHVAQAVIEPISGSKKTMTIPCRWIVQAVGFTPATSLLYQNGCKLAYDESRGHPVVVRHASGMHSAGSVNGHFDPLAVMHDGRRAGLAAVAAMRPQDASLAAQIEELEGHIKFAEADHQPCPAHYVSGSPEKKKFVCLCEDVTEKDICDAVAEGYSNIETLKRYSTVSMGPCQGKMCQAASIAICARANGKSIEETGVTTARPPEIPVPLGVFAGRGVHLSLVRRTPMHDWHERHGAKMGDAGNWKRPQTYTTPLEEYAAVRERVGLIDVSTLGKIELRGRDVVRFLEFIYPNRFENLKVGRVRYGVVCDDAGIILDDGTIARLDDERFFLTTTTGNADAIDNWFRWWLTARPELDVRITTVSGSYAAMNLAGPRSRDVLKKLTDADVSLASMPYLAASQCTIAGIPAIVLRVGFVGELGYEIHVPSQYGLHVWQALLEAGQEFGIQPFGIEAQRMLRLDKKHFLPGVDSDALSNPLEADLHWIVKLDKDDFIGKRSLAFAENRGPRNRLVGFRLPDEQTVDLASLVLCNGKVGGRVTSCGYSPSAGVAVGLAWVPADHSKNGEKITLSVNGKFVTAIVQDDPFYDVPGNKLKS